MSDDGKNEPTKAGGGLGPRSKWVWLASAAGMTAVLFYAWVGLHRDGVKVQWWGQLADSIGLFGTLFNAGALAAALWAVHLQRQESHDSGEATREQLRVMSEQLSAATATAKAQADLAASQAHLAREQTEANRLSWFAETAQRRSSLASLYSARTAIDVARGRNQSTPFEASVKHATKDILAKIDAAIDEEVFRIDFLEKELEIHRTSRGGLGAPQRAQERS